MRLLLIAALLVFSLSPGIGAESGPPARATARDNPLRALEKETFLLINNYRRNQNLPLLAWDETITGIARTHSKDMATGEVDFGHDGFGDRVDQIQKKLVGVRGAGENVFKTDNPDQLARQAVSTWLKSPHHLENIRGDYNYSGLGIWQDDKGMVYFTQIFVKLVPPVPPSAQASQAQSPPGLITPLGIIEVPMSPRPAK